MKPDYEKMWNDFRESLRKSASEVESTDGQILLAVFAAMQEVETVMVKLYDLLEDKDD